MRRRKIESVKDLKQRKDLLSELLIREYRKCCRSVNKLFFAFHIDIQKITEPVKEEVFKVAEKRLQEILDRQQRDFSEEEREEIVYFEANKYLSEIMDKNKELLDLKRKRGIAAQTVYRMARARVEVVVRLQWLGCINAIIPFILSVRAEDGKIPDIAFPDGSMWWRSYSFAGAKSKENERQRTIAEVIKQYPNADSKKISAEVQIRMTKNQEEQQKKRKERMANVLKKSGTSERAIQSSLKAVQKRHS